MGKRGPVPKRKAERRRRNKGKSPKDELYTQATKLQIAGRSKMTKAQLEKAIAKAQAEPPPTATVTDGKVTAPPADDGWHPIAGGWYRALAESGQSEFYEPSDWALAQLVAEHMSRELQPQLVTVLKGETPEEDVTVYADRPMKGASLTAILSAMTQLMVSEADRRRLGIELERGAQPAEEPQSEKVVAMADYRKTLAS